VPPPTNGRLITPVRRRRELGRRLAVGDVLVISLASLLAFVAREQLGRFPGVRAFAEDVPIAVAVIPLWLLIFYIAGAYRPEYLNAGGDAFRRFGLGVVGGVLGLGFVSFLFNLQLSRLYVALLAVFVFIGGGLLRFGVRRWLQSRYRRGDLVQRTLVIGADPDAQQVARALGREPDSAYEVVGHLAPEGAEAHTVNGHPVLGRPEDVLRICTEYHVGCVIVSPAGVEPGVLRDVTIALEGSDVDLAVAPSLFQVVTRRMTIETIGNVPILHVDQIRLRRGKAALKRTLDLLVGCTLLLVLSPVWLVAAIAIRLDTSGPVHFIQPRVGRDGKPFRMVKLRTMVADAETQRSALMAETDDRRFFKLQTDPRVTRVGRHLRRWSIDEIPQLLNVIRGDMSMVGPRPPLPEEVECYDPWHFRRLRVRPGITGVWQVSGRSDVPFEEAVRMDLFYIENWSLGTDLYLMGRTVRAVLGRSGAW
jgi:exopolysaccharide biosynthesis polyprenyl glycosylphosphotransferase